MSMETKFAVSRGVTATVDRFEPRPMISVVDCRPEAPRPIDDARPVALFDINVGEEAAWYAVARAVFNDIGNDLLAFVRQDDVDALRAKLVERRRRVFNDDGSLKK